MRKTQRGLALALTLIILTVIVVLGFGLVTLGIQNATVADAERYSKAALFTAEGGVNRALMQIKNQNTNSFNYVPSNDASTNANVTVTVGPGTVNVNGVSTTVPANTFYILSLGRSKNDRFSRQVGVMVRQNPGGPMFPYAAFGNISVSVQGTGNSAKTDSFDSRVAGYTNYAAAAKGSKGHVGTNSVAGGGISMNGQPTIKGNVQVGAGGDPNTVVSQGGATITGTKTAMSAPMALPPVSVPSLPTQPASSGDLAPGKYYTGALTLNGNASNKITLHAGTYVFDSISTSGNGDRIVIPPGEGPVTIYIKDTFDMGGSSGINNGTGKAGNLLIQVAGSGSTVSLRGSSNGYFAVYAPGRDINLGGTADIMGALVGRTVTAHGTPGIHYDEALSEVQMGNGALEIKSWQRM